MRKQQGQGIIEATCGLVVILPVLIAIVFVALEVCEIYLARENMAQGARQVARQLAITYATNPGITTNNSAQQTVFAGVTFLNIIKSPQLQSAIFNTATTPYTVSVTITGNITPKPDILHMQTVNMVTSSTYMLE
jgi:Flp pilus assembly protein TadG